MIISFCSIFVRILLNKLSFTCLRISLSKFDFFLKSFPIIFFWALFSFFLNFQLYSLRLFQMKKYFKILVFFIHLLVISSFYGPSCWIILLFFCFKFRFQSYRQIVSTKFKHWYYWLGYDRLGYDWFFIWIFDDFFIYFSIIIKNSFSFLKFADYCV